MKTLQQLAEQFAELDVEISGNNVHYAEANAGASQPIIVVHGLTGTHYSMFQMAGVWAEQGKHVIAVDLPGHGASDEIEVRTFNDVAEWFHGVIQELLPKGDFVLVGNSFGCGVVAEYARQYGLRGSSRMILTAPIPGISSLFYSLERLTAHVNSRVARLFYYENRILEPIRISVLLGDRKSKVLRERVSESIRSEGHLVNHRYAFMNLMPASYKAQPLSQPLAPNIAERTTSVVGDTDRIAPKDVDKHMQRVVGKERVISLKNCGHLVHIEGMLKAPEVLNF